MLPSEVAHAISARLETVVNGAASLGGGCIAHACRLETEEGSFFLKWGLGDDACTFQAESHSLSVLRGAGSTLFVPDVLAAADGSDRRPGFLLTEWIEPGQKSRDFWTGLGRGLAELHHATSDQYGFERNNYIGRLPQQNAWSGDWGLFFLERRLKPQINLARKGGKWPEEWDRKMESIIHRLDDLLPSDFPASLLHGDLWSGNVMATHQGTAAVIDPASYFGDRETDLAMTQLFGGFERAFYDAYNEVWPLEPGYHERWELYNLYHLINHLNHFGAGYAGAVYSTLCKFA